MMRHCLLISLFVLLAQGSWAFVVSDTLIIDGEVIYLEEKQTPISDSLNQARRNDFKEKRKPFIWGVDVSGGVQFTQFSISNALLPELQSVKEFLNTNSNANYQIATCAGIYFKIHNNIELGLGACYTAGEVTEESAAIQNFEEGNSISFFNSENQIFQVFESEVQPQVFEMDTLALVVFEEKFEFSSIQIPLRFRFYVNEFNARSRWRAYGEISPTFRSFQVKRKNSFPSDMLFINTSGLSATYSFSNQRYSSYGVSVGAGAEFSLSNKMNAFVQGNWSFPPTHFTDSIGLKYNTQYSSFLVGLRFLIQDGK